VVISSSFQSPNGRLCSPLLLSLVTASLDKYTGGRWTFDPSDASVPRGLFALAMAAVSLPFWPVQPTPKSPTQLERAVHAIDTDGSTKKDDLKPFSTRSLEPRSRATRSPWSTFRKTNGMTFRMRVGWSTEKTRMTSSLLIDPFSMRIALTCLIFRPL
jgi:hypothetical protein